ncbi:MAG: response regulator [Lachnospiraceae bacterium]|nr:response regulator [Lachnospiraceae bacterium]
MYEYAKAVRLCLAEYLTILVLHVIYAFYQYGTETGRMVLLVSAVMIFITFLVAVFVKKEAFVLCFVLVSVLISSTIIGYLVHTLAFAILMFILMAICITVFMDKKYIAVSAVLSVIVSVAYIFTVPERIKENVPIFMHVVYIVSFIAAMVNLYVLVFHARKYMKGMEEKAIEAEHANESKMLFLANMSHEIRTPMNAICGLAELILRDETLSSETRANTESIQTAGKVLISIVNDILDYSKLESGNMEIIPVNYSFSVLINDVLNMMSVRKDDKDVEIRADIQEGLPDSLIGDEIRLRQILFNLLSNAIKYTEKGYVILDVKGKEDTGFVDLTISVTDSGIGIKKEDISKLFTSFQQVDTRKIRNREGTGLGLAICKKLLNLMGGEIEVESTYGVGSKFTVHISQKIAENPVFVEKPKSVEESEPKVVAPDAKVLVVDDNAVNLKVSQGLIRTFGITVDTCKSGRECLEILKDNKDYDIIFIDHMMPELDGIDTLNMIRSDSSEYMKKVPLIALTANVVSGVREMFISEGFDDYVPKPIDMVWLNAILRKYLPKEKQR